MPSNSKIAIACNHLSAGQEWYEERKTEPDFYTADNTDFEEPKLDTEEEVPA